MNDADLDIEDNIEPRPSDPAKFDFFKTQSYVNRASSIYQKKLNAKHKKEEILSNLGVMAYVITAFIIYLTFMASTPYQTSIQQAHLPTKIFAFTMYCVLCLFGWRQLKFDLSEKQKIRKAASHGGVYKEHYVKEYRDDDGYLKYRFIKVDHRELRQMVIDETKYEVEQLASQLKAESLKGLQFEFIKSTSKHEIPETCKKPL